MEFGKFRPRISIIIVNFPCEKIHIDYHFLPKTPRGNKCVLVAIDHLTKRIWLSANQSKEAKNVVDALRVIVNEIHRSVLILALTFKGFMK